MKAWWTILLLVVIPALATGQSLGEDARKERERREKLRKAGITSRTLTEEDLARTKGALANDPNAAPKGAGVGQKARSPAPSRRPEPRNPRQTDSDTGREEYWRGRVAAARARVEQAQRRCDDLDRMIRSGQPAMYEEGRLVIYSSSQMKERADQAQTELQEAQKAYEDLMDEARRDGALPGWLR